MKSVFRFPCRRYLGKGVDDGSSERLLIAELIRSKEDLNVNDTSCNAKIINLVQCRSPLLSRKENKLSLSEIQHMIGRTFYFFGIINVIFLEWFAIFFSLAGDSVNSVVKYFHRFATSRQRENRAKLTPLLCGEMGLVHSLEQAFLYGFKSKSFFGRNLYLWDYFREMKFIFWVKFIFTRPAHPLDFFFFLVRVKEQFDILLQESRYNKHADAGSSLDRKLKNINLRHDDNSDVENENNTGRQSREKMRRRPDSGHIPRSSGLQTFAPHKNVRKNSQTRTKYDHDSFFLFFFSIYVNEIYILLNDVYQHAKRQCNRM